jgi:hypothetical protein
MRAALAAAVPTGRQVDNTLEALAEDTEDLMRNYEL